MSSISDADHQTASNNNKITKTPEQWREQLNENQYAVCRCSATEPAFSGEFWDHKAEGSYHCVCCDKALFCSQAKFDSGTGWPSFFQPATDTAVAEHQDMTHGMIRTEVVCQHCDAHLGHVFPDGPPPTGLRYCINSAALVFKPV